MAHIRSYIISGIVQGVYCRVSIKKWADQYQVYGWVRNLKDGRVQLVCQSEKPGLFADLVNFLKDGPGRVVVEKVEELDLVSIENYNEFVIRPDGIYEKD